ncbi:hypothetical protein TNCV_367461 [Trichonephila clavipes]|nr:hypothetical protein TNCV_367461 [Trichonephila clavipes]
MQHRKAVGEVHLAPFADSLSMVIGVIDDSVTPRIVHKNSSKAVISDRMSTLPSPRLFKWYNRSDSKVRAILQNEQMLPLDKLLGLSQRMTSDYTIRISV